MSSKTNRHSLIGGSNLQRAMECPPSIRLGEQVKDQSSIYAKEGTSAHLLLEKKVKERFGIPFDENTSNLDFYSEEMEECTDIGLNYITEVFEELKAQGKKPFIASEVLVDFSDVVPEGMGSSDVVIVYEGGIHIIDYKHGSGTFVSCENNPQLMIYAYGSLLMFESLFEIEDINMTIIQPRLNNVSEWSCRKDELIEWTINEVKPKAALAWAGQGDFKCGTHCTFCRCRFDCKFRANEMLKVEGYLTKDKALLSSDEISEILSKIDGLISWANDLKEFALNEALKGKDISGYKLVEGRSNRKYSDEESVSKAAKKAGFEDVYRQSLIPLTEMEKMMGKKKFNEVLGELIIKPPGKPTLVPITDKRTEIQKQSEFKEEI